MLTIEAESENKKLHFLAGSAFCCVASDMKPACSVVATSLVL